MSIKVFTDATRKVKIAAEAFDRATGYSAGCIAQKERKALQSAISGLGHAMFAVRNADRAEAKDKLAAAAPDYREIALIFGTALGTALSAGKGYGTTAVRQQGCRVDAALREIFKIKVDKTR